MDDDITPASVLNMRSVLASQGARLLRRCERELIQLPSLVAASTRNDDFVRKLPDAVLQFRQDAFDDRNSTAIDRIGWFGSGDRSFADCGRIAYLLPGGGKIDL